MSPANPLAWVIHSQIKLLNVQPLKRTTMLGKILHSQRSAAVRALAGDEPHKNFCTPEHFGRQLALEKRRAERLSSQFSIVVLSRQGPLYNRAASNGASKDEVRHLAGIICQTLRETDIVSMRVDHTVTIIMPDTDPAGAQCACQRLLGRLLPAANSSEPALCQESFAIEIYSYPERTAQRNWEKNTHESAESNGRQAASLPESVPWVRVHRQMIGPGIPAVCLASTTVAKPARAEPFLGNPQKLQDFSALAQSVLKRTMDIAGAIAGLVLFSPVMAVVAVLIKITSPGPVLFRQKRLGHKGREFVFLKFRSMREGCGDDRHRDYVHKLILGETDKINNGSKETPLYKITDDPRVTPLGRFLRRTSLDELPQLWNVLRGEMSLVGPRPPIPYEIEAYQDWHFRRLLEVKPGITGMWQVMGRNHTTFDEMARLDIGYAKNWSILLDLKILLKTFKVLIQANGS